MLGVHEMCNRRSQRGKVILKPGKLKIYVYMYVVHNEICFNRIHEELKDLDGILLRGGEEEGRG